MATFILPKCFEEKGILRKGKLEFVEKNKKDKRIIYLELTDEVEKQLFDYIQEIGALIAEEKPPECIHKNTCKNVLIMNTAIFKIGRM